MKLLDVQELDSKAAQLRHLKANLPEAAEIATLQADRKQIDDQARDARIARDDLETAQRKAEADVESVRTRRERDQQRIDQGVITNPKDLERMQSELANLERRIGVLEDEELEVMEQLEAAQASVTGFETQLASIDERLAALTATRNERAASIDAELAGIVAERVTTVEGLPADLLALYDKLREAKGGMGAAELRARQCGGCMLTLDNAELGKIRMMPSDEVARCDECSRILVRTTESGL